MCDFIPGYVNTFMNPAFAKITGNIIVLGQDDGKVYSIFSNKDDFFEKITKRKTRNIMMCYYQNLDFTPDELECAWKHRVFPVCEKEKNAITYKWKNELAAMCF